MRENRVRRRRSRLLLAPLLLVLIVVACNTPVDPPPPAGVPTFEVDPTVVPRSPTVEGLEPGDPPRPVGGLADEDGVQMDFVLGEIIASFQSQSDLDAFLDRWNGVVIDSFEPDAFSDPEDPTDYLIRIDPSAVDLDLARMGTDLEALAPEESGAFGLSSEAALRLLALALFEANEFGVEVEINWLSESDAIADGSTSEAPNFGVPDPDDDDNVIQNVPSDAFRWFYTRSGGVHDIGVGAAWQLLEDAGRLDERVTIMIVDGGFAPTIDFPDSAKIRQAEWDNSNLYGCGGNPCPWHGTDVALTAMAQLDNDFGIAGPAGPVAELVAVGAWKDYWKRLRRTRQMVEEERPDIVNMSFSHHHLNALGFRMANRHFRAMRNMGALLFASASNNGENVDSGSRRVMPCESEYVVCVGGLNVGNTDLNPGSNFGTDTGDRTVAIYAPYCYYGSEKVDGGFDFDHPEASERFICGTSFSSPFVAGIAALVKAADPSLGPVEIWEIVRDTAKVGGISQTVGNPRRVDAFAAVDRALGNPYRAPVVVIDEPDDGDVFSFTDFIELLGSASDFRGEPLPIAWELDGVSQGPPTFGTIPFFDGLAVGSYTARATASDITGTATSVQVSFEVINEPPNLAILVPRSDAVLYEGVPFALRGRSEDPDNDGLPLPDSDVGWEIRTLGGAVVFSDTGPQSMATLNQGDYRIRFIAVDDGNESSVTADITVLPPPVGQLPVPSIQSPEDGLVINTGPGALVPLQLTGSALDNEDGAVSGTRFQWLITDENGVTTVLCQGDDFAAAPGFPVDDCSDVEVDYNPTGGLLDGGEFVIELIVRDSDGGLGSDEVSILIRIFVP